MDRTQARRKRENITYHNQSPLICRVERDLEDFRMLVNNLIIIIYEFCRKLGQPSLSSISQDLTVGKRDVGTVKFDARVESCDGEHLSHAWFGGAKGRDTFGVVIGLQLKIL